MQKADSPRNLVILEDLVLVATLKDCRMGCWCELTQCQHRCPNSGDLRALSYQPDDVQILHLTLENWNQNFELDHRVNLHAYWQKFHHRRTLE